MDDVNVPRCADFTLPTKVGLRVWLLLLWIVFVCCSQKCFQYTTLWTVFCVLYTWWCLLLNAEVCVIWMPQCVVLEEVCVWFGCLCVVMRRHESHGLLLCYWSLYVNDIKRQECRANVTIPVRPKPKPRTNLIVQFWTDKINLNSSIVYLVCMIMTSDVHIQFKIKHYFCGIIKPLTVYLPHIDAI